MTRWRRAVAADAVALRDLEREASRAGLVHVFGDHPYPDDDVLARWAIVLDTPGTRVEVAEDVLGPVVLLACDEGSVRHLAVRPDRWGQGLAREAMRRAVELIPDPAPRLWVLAENRRARGLYEHLGWRPTGESQQCPWSPYPIELEYRRTSSEG